MGGLVGLGAGVGYGVGSWIADKMQNKNDASAGKSGTPVEQLPWAVQVALQTWSEFLARRSEGRQLSQKDIDVLWAEFEQVDPAHAMNARALVRGTSAAPPGAASSQAGVTPVFTASAAGG